jgi:predicted nucleic acid-binding Zn ribbon protein
MWRRLVGSESNKVQLHQLKFMYNDKRLHQLWLNVQYRQRYRALGEIIGPFREKLSDTRNKHLTEISEIWTDLVGPDLADLAFPCALRADILIVSVASPAVKFTIEQIYRQAILDQIRDQTGKRLKDIKCTLSASRGD